MSQQYPLPLPHHEALTADHFMVTASNREAVAWALEREPASWPAHCLILYGPRGCGKTHLLTIWREKHYARQLEAGEDVVAEILEAKLNHPPARGEGMRQAFAIDDANKIAGSTGLEEWLQHLYNATKAAGTLLLLAAEKAPSAWGLGLKDIESRLKSCPAIEIKEPDDELMRGMLLKQFNDRQLLVEVDVINYLLPRLERTGTVARETVVRLDKRALEQGRKITVPFVRETIG